MEHKMTLIFFRLLAVPKKKPFLLPKVVNICLPLKVSRGSILKQGVRAGIVVWWVKELPAMVAFYVDSSLYSGYSTFNEVSC